MIVHHFCLVPGASILLPSDLVGWGVQVNVDIPAFKLYDVFVHQSAFYWINSVTFHNVEISLSIEQYERFRRTMFLSFSAMLVMYIGAGFVNNLGMYQAYIAVPYVGGFAILVYWLVLLSQLPKKKDKFRLGEEKPTFNRIKVALLIVGALAVFFLGKSIFCKIVAGSSLEWR